LSEVEKVVAEIEAENEKEKEKTKPVSAQQ